MITIGGRKYRLSFVDKIGDNGDWGKISIENRTILIKRIGNEEEQKRTFLHEVVHGFFSELGGVVEGDEELICDGLANQLYLFIKKNGAEIDWIRKGAIG